MTKFTEGRHNTEGLMSEAPFHRSRENIVIAAGAGVVEPGTILGQITAGAKAAVGAAGVPAPVAATITAAPEAAPGTKVGVHLFVCIVGGAAAASKWRHTDPAGEVVGIASGNTEYSGGGLSALTITDAGTDPEAGETFTVTVSASGEASLEWAPSPDTEEEGIEGAEVARAIALYGCDATTESQKISAIARDAEWNGHTLTYEASVDDAGKRATKAAQLAAVGIIARF
ncbi:head decoration protein [Devosia ginsengisoli]|uniref:head decoration protein n=1 Tax=Devosia ginsengisoli TaxID=400770 RepID=UPI0026F13D18|nr:head decoration protein [Devosia ginsengisoli]MCR6673237.1 head decoration protein [Devosia ginsengisoli]